MEQKYWPWLKKIRIYFCLISRRFFPQLTQENLLAYEHDQKNIFHHMPGDLHLGNQAAVMLECLRRPPCGDERRKEQESTSADMLHCSEPHQGRQSKLREADGVHQRETK